MGGLWEYIGPWLAFFQACQDKWPQIAVGALIATCWAMMRTKLPHVRRWVIRRDRRHYIDVTIILLLVIYVAGSAYAQLYRETKIEQDLSLNFYIEQYNSILTDKVDVGIFATNNGNRGALIRDVLLYTLEYHSDSYNTKKDFVGKCLDLGLLSSGSNSLYLIKEGNVIKFNGVNTQLSKADAMIKNGVEDKMTSFGVAPGGNYSANLRFNKVQYRNDRGNTIEICFSIGYFDSQSVLMHAICSGPKIIFVDKKYMSGSLTMPIVGPYRILPNTDSTRCVKAL